MDTKMEFSRTIIQNTKILQSILASLAEGVIVANNQGKFLFFNPVAKKILGIGLKDVTADQWTSVYGCYYPDTVTDFPADKLPLARAIKGEKVFDELIFIKNPEKPNGVYISVSAMPINQKNGSIVGGSVIFRDVTEDIKSDIVKRQSEERVRAQFKGFPIPTYVWQKQSDDFILIDCNDAAHVFTRGNVKKFLGIKLTEMYKTTPEIIDQFMETYHKKTNLTQEMTYKLITSGEVKELIVSYVYIPPDIVMIHVEDITNRKIAEAELRKLFNAVEQTADSVIITNKKTYIEYVNPAFETTTGYSREEVIGQKADILKSGQHDQAFYNNLWKTISSGKAFRDTIINKKKNGEIYWSQQTITPMKDTQGNITNYVSVLKDITDLKKRQEHEMQLHIARELQQRLYKASNIDVPGFDISGRTYPALETSGDYYDFIHMPDGSLGLVIGDVSGHGIGPALLMSATRAYMRAFIKTESDPGKILTWINRELKNDLDDEHFVTLIFARIDVKNKTLEYASAGHVPAYLLDCSGKVRHVLESTGIPLGVLKEYEFPKSDAIKLNTDDLIVFLTDGIIEAEKEEDNQFGHDRTLDVIKQHLQKSAELIIKKLYQAVRSFSKNHLQEDDITAIVCKVGADFHN